MWFRNLLPNKGNTKETQGEKDLSRSGETNENLNAMRVVMKFFCEPDAVDEIFFINNVWHRMFVGDQRV